MGDGQSRADTLVEGGCPLVANATKKATGGKGMWWLGREVGKAERIQISWPLQSWSRDGGKRGFEDIMALSSPSP